MNRPDAESPYLEPYREAVDAHGTGFEALLWRNREFQRTRFATMAQMASPSGRVLADLGCGRADLLAWLNDEGLDYDAYVGVEGIDELVRFCRARSIDEKLPGATFLHLDFAADPDVFSTLVESHNVDMIVFSGSLNTFDEPDATDVLDRAWQAISRVSAGALVFNFLSTRHPPDASPNPRPAYRFDPVRMLDWALSRTRLAHLRHDYLDGHDATVSMRVNERAG